MKTLVSASAIAGFLIWAPASSAQETVPPSNKTEQDILAEVQTALEDLTAESFQTREAATLKLWSLGEPAESYVREKAESGELEVVMRTKWLLNLFKFLKICNCPI